MFSKSPPNPRPPLISLMLAVTLASQAVATAELSARRALQKLERENGPAAVANLVAIAGFHGQHQPGSWRLLTRHPKQPDVFYEFIVSEDGVRPPKVLDRKETPDLPTIPLLLSALRIDSTDAFRIVDDEAIEAGIGFDRLHYQLRWRGNDPQATWLVTLLDVTGDTAGHLFLEATSGRVVKRQFPGLENSESNQPAPPRRDPSDIRLTPVTIDSAGAR